VQEVYKTVKLLLLPGEDCFPGQMLYFVILFNILRVQASNRACKSVTVESRRHSSKWRSQPWARGPWARSL